MLLSLDQQNRFTDASDSFFAYVAMRRGRFAELASHPEDGPDGQVMADLGEWVWDGHTDVIDDFVSENPTQLSADLLAQVTRWKSGLLGSFLLIQAGGKSFLLAYDYAFELTGISKEPSRMVRNLPAYVNCVIVPFEDRVVYLRSMMEYPVSVGENMRKMVSDDLARIRKEGRLIQTADQLVAAQPAILEAKTRRNATAKSDADFQLHGPSQAYLDGLEGMPKGQHRGKMAGLSWEERKKATQDQIGQRVLARAMPTLAKTHAFKGPEVCSLSGLLAKRTKDQLQELAFVLDMSGVSKLRKQELVDAVAEELDVQLPIYLETQTDDMDVATLKAIRAALQAGGRAVVDPEYAAFAMVMSHPEDIIVNYFVEGSDVVAVLPDELLDELRQLDWDELIADAEENLGQQRDQAAEHYEMDAASYAEKLVWIRGIVPLRTAAHEYRAYMAARGAAASAGESERAIADELLSTWNEAPLDYDFEYIGTAQDECLVARELADLNWWEMTGTEPSDATGYAPGYPGTSFGDTLRDMLTKHKHFSPRPVPEELLEVGHYLDWAIEQPAMRRLVRYVDAHVPDGEDDYDYAENVLDLACGVSHGLVDFTRLMQLLGDHQVFVDEDGMRAVAWLLQQVMNTMPCWEDNGWSPEEAHRMERMRVYEGGRREKKPRPRKKGKGRRH